MNRIDELIKKLCPNGVKFEKIENLTNFEQPTKYIVKSTKYNEEYDIPVLTAGQSFILGYTNEQNGIYNASKEKPVIIFDDFTGAFKWVDFPFKVKSSAIKIITAKNNKTTIRYLYHMMGFLKFYSNEHKRLWISAYSQFKVAVPPLEVQCEIVHILDDFTLLSAEISAELKARQKQYEYYLYKLISDSKKITKNKLYELTIWDKKFNAVENYMQPNVKKYPTLLAVDLFNLERENGNVFLLSTGGQRGWTTEEVAGDNISEGEVVTIPWGKSRPVQEVMKYYCGKFVTGDNRIATSNDIKKLNNKYLFYWMQTQSERIDKFYRGSGIQHPNMRNVLTLEIELPSIDEQKRIVSILDKFEKLCNDISQGLPAEIEARQKQYEYYRDKLLTFKELKVNE